MNRSGARHSKNTPPPPRRSRPGLDRFRLSPVFRAVDSDATVRRMSKREERVARNEATSRDINEGLEQAHAADPPESFFRIVCECGQDSCDRLIAITLAEYERVRADALRFAVLRDHVIADVELVIKDTDRFVVVAKREGTPAQVASEDNPKS
jgi:hypothetical protein